MAGNHGTHHAAPGDVPAPFAELFRRAARTYGLDPALLWAVAMAESSLDPRAVSPAGAIGLMQLMPETARMFGCQDPFDPAQNIDAGARYLRQLLDQFGDVSLALAAYNAGPHVVERYGGIPPYRETRYYVNRVLSLWESARGRWQPPVDMAQETQVAAAGPGQEVSGAGPQPASPAAGSAPAPEPAPAAGRGQEVASAGPGPGAPAAGPGPEVPATGRESGPADAAPGSPAPAAAGTPPEPSPAGAAAARDAAASDGRGTAGGRGGLAARLRQAWLRWQRKV